jgi:hypothetical protein
VITIRGESIWSFSNCRSAGLRLIVTSTKVTFCDVTHFLEKFKLSLKYAVHQTDSYLNQESRRGNRRLISPTIYLLSDGEGCTSEAVVRFN